MTTYRQSTLEMVFALGLLCVPCAAFAQIMPLAPVTTVKAPAGDNNSFHVAITGGGNLSTALTSGGSLAGAGKFGVQAWETDRIFVNLNIDGSASTTLTATGDQHVFGDFVLNPQNGIGVDLQTAFTWPVKQSSVLMGPAIAYQNAGASFQNTETVTGRLNVLTIAAQIASKTLNADDTTGTKNQIQFGGNVGWTWRAFAGDLGQQTDFLNNANVLGSPATSYNGLNLTAFIRINSMIISAQSTFIRKNPTEVAGLTGFQQFASVTILGNVFHIQ